MAALTITTTTVKDGGGSNVSAGTCTDGTRQLPAVGLLMADGATFLGLGQQPAGASLPVVLTAAQLATLAPPADAAAAGNLTALNQAVTLTGLNGRSDALLQLAGTFVGSVVVEYSNDSFATVKTASYLSPTGVVNAAQTAPGFYRYTGISGYAQARARCSAYTSGTIAATLVAGSGVDAGTVISVIPDNFNTKDNAAATTAAPSYTNGTTNPLSMDLAGNLRVIQGASIPAGTNVVGKVGIDQTTPGTTNAVVVTAATSGGWTPTPVISAATTNATSVKASAGQIGYANLVNTGAAVAFIKFYDKASAPTVGTDTPVAVIGLPAGGGNAGGIPAGLKFVNGIAYAITGGAANSDTTAVAANQVVGTLGTA